jgi:TetR/AcrR family fatty acid metabolism transcriptional regulator
MLREKAKASRRRAILSAAGRQFARRPYQEVLLEEIATDAQVAKGTLYLYFENKADLYLALVFESLGPLMERLEEQVPAATERSALAGIGLFITELLKFRAEHPALHEVLRGTSPASVEAMCGDLKKSMYGLVEQTLRQGIMRGELVDPAPWATAELILASVSRAAQWMLIKDHEWTAEATAEHLVRLFGDGLRVRRKPHAREVDAGRNAKTGAVHG